MTYKLFSLVVLNKLREANVDVHIWPTQFKFSHSARVTDALLIARRFSDQAHAIKHNKLVLLAPDLANAFDSIMPGPMVAALRDLAYLQTLL